MEHSNGRRIAIWLLEMFEESTLIQGTVTLIFVITLSVIVILEREVPSILIEVTLLVIGFWFGSKSQQQTNATLQRVHGLKPVTPMARKEDDNA
jgi:hypothetical protein